MFIGAVKNLKTLISVTVHIALNGTQLETLYGMFSGNEDLHH